MRRILIISAVLAAVVGIAPIVSADIVTPFTGDIDFNEYAFPGVDQVIQGPGGSSSASYNIFDDSTGAELAADNGDLDDMTMTFTTGATGANGDPSYPRIRYRATGDERFTLEKRYLTSPGSNNPGTRQTASIEVRFADHLDLTDVSINTRSLNTASLAWEYSIITFLDQSGNPFSAAPAVSDYLTWAPGQSGQSGLGHYIATATGTVQDVGTDTVSLGTDGVANNGVVSGANAGLTPGTLIGGFVITSVYEDVRGVNNLDTQEPANIRQIAIGGTITQVIPDADLAVTKSSTVTATQVIYDLTVTNNGPETGNNIIVTDTLPANVTYVSDNCGGVNGTPWTWNVGSMLNGEVQNCQIVTNIQTFGLTENTVSVTADEDDPDTSNNTFVDSVDTTPTTTTTVPTTSTTAPSTTTTQATTSTTSDVSPSTLPFTGPVAAGPLSLLAVSLIALGALAVRSRREA